MLRQLVDPRRRADRPARAGVRARAWRADRRNRRGQVDPARQPWAWRSAFAPTPGWCAAGRQASVAAEIRASGRPSGLRAARRAGHRARSRASRCCSAGRSRPTAAAAPSPAAAGVPAVAAARHRRTGWSKSTASMTTAGLLNPRGHRALLDAFGRIDTGDGRDGLGRGRAARSASWPRRAEAAERRSATATGWTMPPRKSPRSHRSRARRPGSPRSGRRCRPGPRPARR